VEGGGTSWSVAIIEGSPENVIERQSFVTEAPSETIGSIREWLKSRTFDALGVATFGPVDANPKSTRYGYITSTPKPGL
jgi:fructokinase